MGSKKLSQLISPFFPLIRETTSKIQIPKIEGDAAQFEHGYIVPFLVAIFFSFSNTFRSLEIHDCVEARYCKYPIPYSLALSSVFIASWLLG